jgi:hypothetical protein
MKIEERSYTLPFNLFLGAVQCVSAQPAGHVLGVHNAHGEPLLAGSLLHQLQEIAREQDAAYAKAEADAAREALRAEIKAEGTQGNPAGAASE